MRKTPLCCPLFSWFRMGCSGTDVDALSHCCYLQTGRALITIGLYCSPVPIMSEMDRNEIGSTTGEWAEYSRSLKRTEHTRLTGMEGSIELQEECTQGWNFIRDERIQKKEGRRHKQRGRSSLGQPYPHHFLHCPPDSLSLPSSPLGDPSPTSQPPPPTGHPLSPTRETDLLLPFFRPRSCYSDSPGAPGTM